MLREQQPVIKKPWDISILRVPNKYVNATSHCQNPLLGIFIPACKVVINGHTFRHCLEPCFLSVSYLYILFSLESTGFFILCMFHKLDPSQLQTTLTDGTRLCQCRLAILSISFDHDAICTAPITQLYQRFYLSMEIDLFMQPSFPC